MFYQYTWFLYFISLHFFLFCLMRSVSVILFSMTFISIINTQSGCKNEHWVSYSIRERLLFFLLCFFVRAKKIECEGQKGEWGGTERIYTPNDAHWHKINAQPAVLLAVFRSSHFVFDIVLLPPTWLFEISKFFSSLLQFFFTKKIDA